MAVPHIAAPRGMYRPAVRQALVGLAGALAGVLATLASGADVEPAVCPPCPEVVMAPVPVVAPVLVVPDAPVIEPPVVEAVAAPVGPAGPAPEVTP